MHCNFRKKQQIEKCCKRTQKTHNATETGKRTPETEQNKRNLKKIPENRRVFGETTTQWNDCKVTS